MSETTVKVINCKAAVAWAPKKPLVIEEIQVAPPKAHEVRIRIVSTGVCHTDSNSLAGHESRAIFPTILSHEGAGIVESVGKGVTKFKVGDHVIPLFIPQCNECKCCLHPDANYCQKLVATQFRGVMPDGTTRFTCKGQTIHHFFGTSTFAEYTVVTDISLCKINDKAPLEKVCLLACGIPTGYGAAINTAKVKPGSICAVWGLGSVGLAVVMGCKKAGASRIYGIDINSDKFEVAKKFGLTDFINPKDVADKGPIQQYLVELTGGGFDYTFESVGNVHTMRAAFESTRFGSGTSIVIGLPSAGQEVSTLATHLVMGRTWKGTIFGGWKSVTDIPKLIDEYVNKQLMVDEFITHTFSLKDINTALDLMHTSKSLRSVVKM